MKLALDISKWGGIQFEKVEQVMRSVSLDLAVSVISLTPVDTGRAKANWQAGISSAPNARLIATDKNGGATISKVQSVVNQISKSKLQFFLVNNLPYIEELERGSSDQAPAGMVGITIGTFPGLVKEGAAKARK